MIGVVLALTASVGFGATAVFARLGVQHIGAVPGTLISLTVSMVVTVIIATLLHPRDMIGISGTALALAFIVALLSYPIGRLLSFTGVRLVGISRSSTIVGAAPLFATALAVALTGESVSLPLLLGSASIIGGMTLILSQR
jgi:drug/metabolite transporter (DMT)-like permease